MYLLKQQELFILYIMRGYLNKCHQLKRIALEYRQEGYNIFRQTSLENLPFFVMKTEDDVECDNNSADETNLSSAYSFPGRDKVFIHI